MAAGKEWKTFFKIQKQKEWYALENYCVKTFAIHMDFEDMTVV